MSGELQVVIDEREKRSGLHETFQKHDDVSEVETEMLEIGDVIINGTIVFERKTPGDFIGSIQNRRLESQIERMYEIFGPENTYIAIEGDMSDFDNMQYTQFPAKAARGYVGSLSARWQCVPLFTTDQTLMVDTMTRIARKHFESTNRVVRDPTDSPSKGKDDFFARTVLQLSGVGKSKIKPLRKEFESVSQLSEATNDELTSIDGIGNKTAKSIIDQFGGNDD